MNCHPFTFGIMRSRDGGVLGMANEEVLAYRPFTKTDSSPVLYWRAYRRENQGGFLGTSVVATTVGVFTAPTEERLKELAKELGYGLHRDADPGGPSNSTHGVGSGTGSPALDTAR